METVERAWNFGKIFCTLSSYNEEKNVKGPKQWYIGSHKLLFEQEGLQVKRAACKPIYEISSKKIR